MYNELNREDFLRSRNFRISYCGCVRVQNNAMGCGHVSGLSILYLSGQVYKPESSEHQQHGVLAAQLRDGGGAGGGGRAQQPQQLCRGHHPLPLALRRRALDHGPEEVLLPGLLLDLWDTNRCCADYQPWLLGRGCLSNVNDLDATVALSRIA